MALLDRVAHQVIPSLLALVQYINKNNANGYLELWSSTTMLIIMMIV